MIKQARFDLGVKRPFAWMPSGFVTFEAFLDEALRLDLGPRRPSRIINLEEDRFLFALLMAAGWLRGIETLMPPDRSPRHLEKLLALHPGAIVYGGAASKDRRILQRPPTDRPKDPGAHHAWEAVPCGVTAFTSGTTGDPLPYQKSFDSLSESARLIDQHLGGSAGVSVVATVPSQHMYGLELGILLALFQGAILTPSRPFFPADIRETLQQTPMPRMLVTTPVHLKACLDSGLDFPEMKAIVSATATLSQELAGAAEKAFKAPLFEIYGCTEGGSLAGRMPCRSAAWQWFENVSVATDVHGLSTVRALHVPNAIPLGDFIRPLDEVHFDLEGRCGDLINVAGKRSSIESLNRIILEVTGVQDACFFMPDVDASGGTVRLVLLVQAAEEDVIEKVERHIRQTIDPAFWPRLIHRVPKLPRNATGKLPRAALLSLLKGWDSAAV